MPVQVMSRPRRIASAVPAASSLAGRCERASRERLGRLWRDFVAASLPLGAVLGATSMRSGSRLGLLSKVRRLFGWFVPRGFPRTNHPLFFGNVDLGVQRTSVAADKCVTFWPSAPRTGALEYLAETASVGRLRGLRQRANLRRLVELWHLTVATI